MATVNAIAQLLILEFGASTGVAAHVTKVEAFVNDAYKDLARQFPWPWHRNVETVNTVNGTAEYSLATSAAEILCMRNGTTLNDYEIIPSPVQWMMGHDLEATGAPTHYYLSGYDASTGKIKFRLSPVPNGAYAVLVEELVRPGNLATSDTVPIPEEFIPVLKYRVRMLMAADDKDYEAVKLWSEIFETEVAKAKIRYGYRPIGERAPKEVGR